MISYLTGVTGPYLEQGLAHERNIGLLIQPRNGSALRVGCYPTWGADNSAFSKHGFDAVAFRAMLKRPEVVAARATCRFVAAPDKIVVTAGGFMAGDAAGTLEQYLDWAPEIRDQGFPVALVAQDGLEHMLGRVPWHLVDVLFLGGGTEWKLSGGARLCVAAAQVEGKPTHMGRVNSYKRLSLADSWGVDTADGTFLGFGPNVNLPRLLGWLDKLENKCRPSPVTPRRISQAA